MLALDLHIKGELRLLDQRSDARKRQHTLAFLEIGMFAMWKRCAGGVDVVLCQREDFPR